MMGIGFVLMLAGIPPFIDVTVAESDNPLHLLTPGTERRFVKWKALTMDEAFILERTLQEASDEGWTFFGPTATSLLFYRYEPRGWPGEGGTP